MNAQRQSIADGYVGRVTSLTGKVFAVVLTLVVFAAGCVAARLVMDESFGDHGKLVVAASLSGAAAIIEGRHGDNLNKLIVLDKRSRLVRFRPDGSPDTSFGVAGIAEISDGLTRIGFALVELPSGRLATVGVRNVGSSPSGFRVALSLFTQAGSLVREIDTGIVPGPTTGRFDIAVQATGKIVVSASVAGSPAYERYYCEFRRYLSNGDLDATFGSAGVSSIYLGSGYPTPGEERRAGDCTAIAVQSDGAIVAAGSVTPVLNPITMGLVFRLDEDGASDTAFGENGRSVIEGGGFFVDLAMQEDKILVTSLNGMRHGAGNFSLYRFTSAGALDPTFGLYQNGDSSADMGADEYGNSVALLPSGEIVLGGGSMEWVNGQRQPRHFAIALFSPNGILNIATGTNGKLVTQFESYGSEIRAMTVTSNGAVVAAGELKQESFLEGPVEGKMPFARYVKIE